MLTPPAAGDHAENVLARVIPQGKLGRAAGGGGRWEWHQDYGYWYQNGCLYPDMLSVAVALVPATREIGCMQLLAGSHKLGRLEHGRVAGQTGADPERVERALARLQLVHCEMAAGDALFFHANTLHCFQFNDPSRPLSAMSDA